MKIKKIALIETKAVKTHVFSRVYLPRLGVPILSGELKRAGYEVETFFQEMQPLDLDYLMGFDIIGLSSITSTVPEAFRLGSLLSERGKTVVMGGPHVTAMAEEALEHCQYVIRGEGEAAFLEFLKAMNNGEDLSNVQSLSYKPNGTVIHNPSSTLKVDLSKLADADFSSCKYFAGPEDYPAEMMFSRGCPYDCNFCSVTTTFGRKYRYKPTEQVMREIEPFLNRTINFIDDNFAANPQKTKHFLKTMLDTGKVPNRYSCQIRVNAAKDEELLELMRKTNCRIAYVGLESVNPETLKQYKKGQTTDQIASAIQTFRKHGIGLHGMFVLGSDNDTRDTITKTADFAIESGLDTVQICALTPFPGTAVYDQMVNEGRVLHQRWELYDGLHTVIRPKLMTPYELQVGIFEEMKRFYSLINVCKISLQKRWRFKYRLGGRYLVNKWITENADYFDYLKNLPEPK